MKILKRKIDLASDEISIIFQTKKICPDFAEYWSRMHELIIHSPSFSNYLDGTSILTCLNLYSYLVNKTKKTDCYSLYLALMLINIKSIETDNCGPYILEYDEYEKDDEKKHAIWWGYSILKAERDFNLAKSYVECFGTEKFANVMTKLYGKMEKEYECLKKKIDEFEEKFSSTKIYFASEVINKFKEIYIPFGIAFKELKQAYDEYIYEDRLLVNSPHELRELAKKIFKDASDKDEVKGVLFTHGNVVWVPVDITIGTTIEKTAKRIIVHGNYNDFSGSASDDVVEKVGESNKGSLSWAASQRGGTIIYYWRTSNIDDEIAELYRKKDAEMLEIDCVI